MSDSKGGELMSIGERLRELRGSETQEKMGERFGIATSTWAMYERGDRVPRDEIKSKIARYYGKTVDELFFQ